MALRTDSYVRASVPSAIRFIDVIGSEVMSPSKIVCIGWNYRPHVRELESELPKEPTVFLKPPSCLIGDGDEIVIPAGVTNVQHEVELALVFGRRCKDVSEEDALLYISEAAVFNDVSARDMQTAARKAGNTWDLSKGMDTFGPMSEPVPVESVGDLQDLELTLTVNGDVRQRGNTRDMIFTVPELIAYVTRFMTMEPGDILITGTPEGVSEIRPGDVVRAEIEGVGAVTNHVVSGARPCRPRTVQAHPYYARALWKVIMTVVEIRIELKKGVADPEGKNTRKTLESLGFEGITDVRTVKLFEVESELPADEAKAQAEEMCRKLLANPVIQNFRVSVR